MTLSRWAVTILSVSMMGCDGPAENGKTVATRDRALSDSLVTAAAARDHRALSHGWNQRVPICGTATTAPAPSEVLVVTAEHCLGCRDVGYAARMLERRGRATGTTFAVFTPATDSVAVCEHLREQRVSADVYAMPDDLVADGPGAPLWYVSFGADGRVRQTAKGVDAVRLGAALDSLESLRVTPAAKT